jgi:DNA-binding beta-propeller fold protein YncE
VGNGAMGIVFDGSNVWVANRGDGSVSKLRASDGQVLGTFDAPGAPYGVAFDGKNIWVTGSPYLMKLRATDGALLSKITLLNTSGIIFDGNSLWVAQTPTSLIEFETRE